MTIAINTTVCKVTGHKFVPSETINLPAKGGSVLSDGTRVVSVFCERCVELLYLGDRKNG